MTGLLTPPFKVFPKAPIREALIDIRTEPPTLRSVEDLKLADQQARQEYPTEQVRRVVQRVLRVSEGSDPSENLISESIEGYQYWNTQKNQVVQFRRNGFTFSRLPRYERWERLRDEARRLWELYTIVAKPNLVTRIAARFINSIEIPGRQIELSDYFTAPPTIPEDLPQTVNECLLRYSMRFPEQNAQAIVQFAFPHGPVQNSTKVLLDIDVFREQDYLSPFDDMWTSIDELGILKDNIFFRYITEKTEKLFQ